MDVELMGFLLGIAVSVIAVLVPALGLSMRANSNSRKDNPNFDTVDSKLNQILICLTRIEGKLGGD